MASTRKLVDVDYYIDLGRRAYGTVVRRVAARSRAAR